MESRNWLELPSDITATILQKIGVLQILRNADKVCSSWRKICKDPVMWRVIDTKSFGHMVYFDPNLEILFKRAVDRSCGQLVEISIELIGTDQFLEYITRSSNQLRKLRIICCNNISKKGLMEAVSKLPSLEHLEIFLCSFEGSELITSITSRPFHDDLVFERIPFLM